MIYEKSYSEEYHDKSHDELVAEIQTKDRVIFWMFAIMFVGGIFLLTLH